MPLTRRQKEVVTLIAEGWPYKEIGKRLGITEQGVQRHVDRIKLVIPVSSTSDLTRYALANGLAENEFLDNNQRKKV